MTGIRTIFKAFAAGLFVSSAGLAQGLDLGEMRLLDAAVEELKQDGWRPLALGAVADKSVAAMAFSALRQKIVIFFQPDTDQWRLGTYRAGALILQSEGTALTLLPLQAPAMLKTSFRTADLQPVQNTVLSPLCADAMIIDDILKLGSAAVPVIRGIDSASGDILSFYASYQDSSDWALTRTTREGQTCIKLLGDGYILGEHSSFAPVWKRNISPVPQMP